MDEPLDESLVLVATAAATKAAQASNQAQADGTESVVRIGRPADTPDEAGNVDVHITKQWARIRTAEAMDRARKIADKGDFKQGQQLLDEALQEVRQASSTVQQQQPKQQTDQADQGSDQGVAQTASTSPNSTTASTTTVLVSVDDALLANLLEQLQEC